MATLQHSGADTPLHALIPHSAISDDIIARNRGRFDVLPHSFFTSHTILLGVRGDARPRNLPEKVCDYRVVVRPTGAVDDGDLALVCEEPGGLLLAYSNSDGSFTDAHTEENVPGQVQVVGWVMEQQYIFVHSKDRPRKLAFSEDWGDDEWHIVAKQME